MNTEFFGFSVPLSIGVFEFEGYEMESVYRVR